MEGLNRRRDALARERFVEALEIGVVLASARRGGESTR